MRACAMEEHTRAPLGVQNKDGSPPTQGDPKLGHRIAAFVVIDQNEGVSNDDSGEVCRAALLEIGLLLIGWPLRIKTLLGPVVTDLVTSIA